MNIWKTSTRLNYTLNIFWFFLKLFQNNFKLQCQDWCIIRTPFYHTSTSSSFEASHGIYSRGTRLILVPGEASLYISRNCTWSNLNFLELHLKQAYVYLPELHHRSKLIFPETAPETISNSISLSCTKRNLAMSLLSLPDNRTSTFRL